MPRTSEQNKKIREATRSTILTSAIAMFAQNGYSHTTIRKISEHADISTGLMYHYFDKKESLLRAVFDDCMEELSESFEVVIEHNPPTQWVPGLLQVIFDLLARDKDYWALFYMMRNQPAIMEILGDSFRFWTLQLRTLFVEGLSALAKPEPEIEAYILYCLVEGTIQQYLLDPLNYPLDKVTERIMERYQIINENGGLS